MSRLCLLYASLVLAGCGASTPPVEEPAPAPAAATAAPVPEAQALPTPTVAPGFARLAVNRFAFAVPETWVRIQPPFPQIQLHMRDPEPHAGIHWNANMWVEPFAGTTADYAAQSRQQLEANGAVVHRFEVQNVGGVDVIVSDVSLAITDPPTRAVQIGFLSNGEAFVLTCTGPETAFEERRAMCEEIMRSVEIY